MQVQSSDKLSNHKKCINCGFENEEKFCSSCGNPMFVKKLNFSTLIKDTLGQIYGFDGRFLSTIRDLTIKPDQVIMAFINGNRKRYIGPVSYYFLLYAILLIYTSMIDVNLSEIAPQAEDMQRGVGLDPTQQSSEQLRLQKEMREMIFRNIQYFGVIGFPFFALVGRWFYKKSGFTFIEHFVTAFYLHAQPLILSFCVVSLVKLTGQNFQLYALLISISYYLWGISKVYHKKFSFGSSLKALAFYIVYYIFFILIVAIAVFIIGKLYYI